MSGKVLKAVLISCFDAYDMRLKFVEDFLINKGYEVSYIAGNYDHIKKIKYTVQRPNLILIDVIPYVKNLSVKRLISHYFFAKKALKQADRIKPDLLYVMIPPNSLALFASKYKKRNKVKLIFDLYDLWPETFPSTKAKKLLSIPFSMWKNLRDKGIMSGDSIITECDLFQVVLKEQLIGRDVTTLYSAKEKPAQNSITDIACNSIAVCYLGSINNIIDISLINSLLTAINKIKPVTLHIIGDGENRDKFIDTIKSSNIKVEFYGKVFDDKNKQEIFDKCLFGINIMKETVCVGLSLKSIDYFQAGLPILNNIKADTAKLVEKYKIGINVNEDNIEEVATEVTSCDKKQLLEMRANTLMVFESIFSIGAFNNKLQQVIK